MLVYNLYCLLKIGALNFPIKIFLKFKFNLLNPAMATWHQVTLSVRNYSTMP